MTAINSNNPDMNSANMYRIDNTKCTIMITNRYCLNFMAFAVGGTIGCIEYPPPNGNKHIVEFNNIYLSFQMQLTINY